MGRDTILACRVCRPGCGNRGNIQEAKKRQGEAVIVNHEAMSKKEDLKPAADVTKIYEPTVKERAAEEAVRAHWKETPRVKVSSDENAHKIEFEHPSPYHACFVLMEALGTADSNFYQGIVPQLAKAATVGQKVDEQALNFMISVIKGVEPRDQLETLLAAQMAVTHMLTMTFGQRLNNVDNLPQQDSAASAFNKLARTFFAQVETLKRYRSSGEQRVTVQHVSVGEGGQAVVGLVNHRGEGSSEKVRTTP